MGEMDRTTAEKIEKAFERFQDGVTGLIDNLKEEIWGTIDDEYLNEIIYNMKEDIRYSVIIFENAIIWEIKYSRGE